MPTLGAMRRRLKRGAAGRVIPTLWLFSDPLRLPDPGMAAARLPRGAGVVARGLAPGVLRKLVRIARTRGLRLMVAGDGRLALALRAGLHLPERRPSLGLLPFLAARRNGAPFALLSSAAHGGGRATGVARRLGVDLVFLSPAFPTASHPRARAFGPLRWGLSAKKMFHPVVALGGVTPAAARRLPAHAAGLAAIGWLSRPNPAMRPPVACPPHCAG